MKRISLDADGGLNTRQPRPTDTCMDWATLVADYRVITMRSMIDVEFFELFLGGN